MPASVADFVKAAEGSGILKADSLDEFLRGVAPEADATALADRLVKAGRITAFQAKHIYGGKADSLILGPYIVADLIGKGGMGYVYKAEHRRMRRVVALKVIAKAALKSPAAVQRFEREVQAAARLDHPNIVTAHDAGEAAGTHYLVMQFVDGRNLSEVVKELGPQPVDRAVDWVLQAARGLAYAHGKGVVHRDIKPGNLLVDQDGAVKILDMGLARLSTLDADQDQLTGTGQIMGTVDYMAPEQAMDTRQADARSDIYSLGVTLWYLLTGRPLFSGDTAMNKMMAHMHTAAPSLLKARSEISPDLETLFQKMVAKKPSDRFQSMQDVITALQSLLQSKAVVASLDVAMRFATVIPVSRGAAATQTLEQPKRQLEADAEENTARLSAVEVDTDPGLKRVPSRPQYSTRGLKPLHLAIGGGAVGAVMLVGLLMFAFSARRDVERADRDGQSGGGSASQPAARLDAVASVAITDTEPTVLPRTESKSTAPSPAARSSTPPPPAVATFDAAQARKLQEAWAKHLGMEVKTINSIGQTLVVIPPGTFKMGEGEEAVDVTLTKPFLLGQTEVTQGQWKEVMGTEPWKGQDYTHEGAEVAATFVSWDDAVAFCAELTERERSSGRLGYAQAYRLPTGVEWEHACRGGTDTPYYFGPEALIGEHAWYGGGWSGDKGVIPGGNTGDEPYAHPVRSKNPNPWGLYDMHGNVWEWTANVHAEDGVQRMLNPRTLQEEIVQHVRGGCWASGATPVFYSGPQVGQHGHVGFRVVLELSGHDLDAVAEIDNANAQQDAPPLATAPFDATQARKHQEAWAQHLGIEVETTNSIGQTLVVIPPGEFKRGECDKAVWVTLTKPFLLGQTEVTQGQWKAVMGTEPWKTHSISNEGRDVAVSLISWDDAVLFCSRLTDVERSAGVIASDQHYRLPSETEWEYACRAGTENAYFFGPVDQCGDYAWFGGGWTKESGMLRGGNTVESPFVHPVKQKKPNPWGLYDIYGNVWEWVANGHTGLAGTKEGEIVATETTPSRPIRGGSWLDTAAPSGYSARAAATKLATIGFRVVLVLSGNDTGAVATVDNASAQHDAPPLANAPFGATQARKHQEAWAKHLGIEVEVTNSIGQKFVVIPPGHFTMGEGEKAVDVAITNPFLIGQTEVTQGQWREVMGTEPCKGKLYVIVDDDAAVTYVTWHDAVAFCKKLTSRERASSALGTAWEYRLPTSAEWEHACRAGTKSTFSFGNDETVLGTYAWYGNGWDATAQLPIPGGNTSAAMHAHIVGRKKPNNMGLYDIHGNVFEWIGSDSQSSAPAAQEKWLLPKGGFKTCRGGSWLLGEIPCRSASHKQFPESGVSGDLGFRIVRSQINDSSPETAPSDPSE